MSDHGRLGTSGSARTSLDDAIAAVRDDAPPPGVEERAAQRVGALLGAEGGEGRAVQTIGSCADVLALLEAHRRGALAPARAMLVEDHLRECVACRATSLRPARRLALLPWRPETRPAPAATGRRAYAIAASVLLAAALAATAVHRAYFAVPAGSRAAVQSFSGALQRVGGGRAARLAAGEEVGEAEPVRTGRASRAVLRLTDGSLVEMGERAEIAVTARGSDTTIALARGAIIVRAAHRRSGHLRVVSGEATVRVTGTVFSVSHGLKGSRVSVLEGQVRVAAGGGEEVVSPGGQWTTSQAVERLPLEEEVAWSGDLDQHLALLAEVKVLRDRWQAVRVPGLRYETRLLPVVPERAAVFASLPNYGEALAEAHRLFEERLRESETLREWWRRVDPAQHGGPSLAQVIEKVRGFSSFLGDEIVLAAVEADEGRDMPLLLAELRRPGLAEFLAGEIAGGPAGPPVRVLEDPAAVPATAPADAIFVLVHGGIMAVSPSPAALADVARRLDGGSAGLDATDFGARLRRAYEGGVGVLFAADLEHIRARITAAQAREPRREEALRRSGLDALRYLVVERKQEGGATHSDAVLTFDGPARGLPSWLAAPGPIGSLEFVSAQAEAAAAFVVKSPALMFDDVMGLVGDEDARQSLADLESKLDLRLREDLAETLGSEFAVALDGPLLPTPAWKVVVEVDDPGRLQASLETLVARAADEAVREGRPALRLEAEQVGEDTFFAIRGLPGFDVHYAYSGGYLVAAPSRALVLKAIQGRAAGETLARSARLRALFRPDRDLNVSALLYQDMGPLVTSLLDAPGAASLSAEQRRSVQALAGDARPTLLCAYGEPDGIRVAGLGGVFDLQTGDLALPLLVQRVFSGTARVATP